MYVCHCMGVSDRTVRAAVAAGASTLADVAERCGAGSGCGGCHLALLELLAECERAAGPPRRALAALGTLAPSPCGG